MDVMEQEMETVKEQLRLPGIKRSLEQLAQNVIRSIQSTEEMQKLVASLVAQRESALRKGGEGDATVA